MAREVYGVDIESEFSLIDARDAIVRCFAVAHDEVLQETLFSGQTDVDPEEAKQMKELDVRMLISQMFAKIGGDFDHPTKESLLAVMDELQKFAANFRNQEIVEKHAKEIGLLLEKLPE